MNEPEKEWPADPQELEQAMRADERDAAGRDPWPPLAWPYVTTSSPATSGRKDDGGKPDWMLLPWRALRSVVRVLMFGAKKYGRDNWRLVPDARNRYWNAAIRHLVAWQQGEDRDPETGESHLSHAVCCCLFMLDGEEQNREAQNR